MGFAAPLSGLNICHQNFLLLLVNLCDQELGERLAVACLSPVVLLGVHFEDGQLGPLGVLQHLCLHNHSLQVGLANMEDALIFQGKHAAQLHLAAWLSLQFHTSTLHTSNLQLDTIMTDKVAPLQHAHIMLRISQHRKISKSLPVTGCMCTTFPPPPISVCHLGLQHTSLNGSAR